MERHAVTGSHLKTPSAAAIAGLLFSSLLITTFALLRISVPADPQEPGSWLRTDTKTVALAMNLVPFAGIAFLWFIGVLRDRLGQLEDRFFATVFFGSGLLFLATLFVSSAIVGGVLMAFVARPDELIGSATFQFARAVAYAMMNIYVVKTAGVFMISTSTIALFTGIVPRWLAIFGFALALLLLLGSYYISWSFVVFPLWCFSSVHLYSLTNSLFDEKHDRTRVPNVGAILICALARGDGFRRPCVASLLRKKRDRVPRNGQLLVGRHDVKLDPAFRGGYHDLVRLIGRWVN